MHLSGLGSRPQLDYRHLNHGEKGVPPALLIPNGTKLGFCQIRDVEDIRQLQTQVSDNPDSVVYWRLRREKDFEATRLPKAVPSSFSECVLPWPLLVCPKRCPF